MQAATKSVQTALEKSVLAYEELLERYTRLKEEDEKRQLSEAGESRGYVMVLVDACGLKVSVLLRF
jgi:hypothetical protein